MNEFFSMHPVVSVIGRLIPVAIVIPFALLSTHVGAGAQVSFRIGYASPWRAGVETIRKSPSKAYTTKLLGKEGYAGLTSDLGEDRLDIAMVLHGQWIFSVIGGSPFVAVASVGPRLAIVNKRLLNQRKKREALTEFLNLWQGVWLSSRFPYGVQPPRVKFLARKYETLVSGALPGAVTMWKDIALEKLVPRMINRKVVKWERKLARVLVKDYALSIRRSFTEIKNAQPGESYTGTIEGEGDEFLLVDRNPCNGWLVNFTSPYESRPEGTTECGRQRVALFKVTQK